MNDQQLATSTFARLDRKDIGISILLFIATLILLLSTMQMGFTRDESFYFHAAYDYIRWFEDLARHFGAGELSKSFTKANIDKHWTYNPEHPVLMKTLFALSNKLFHEKLEWMSNSTAMRFPTAVMASWLVAMVYAFGRQVFGRAAGLIAACALLLQPRFFFHAHMACFDVPIAAMWFSVVYAYWKSYDSKKWAILTGVLWGLALATKLNAFFLPVVLVVHWLLTRGRAFAIKRDEDSRWYLTWPRMPWAFVCMALIAPVIFYIHWPRIWYDTVARVWWYMKFHMTHEHYFVQYFGQWLQHPPFPRSYPWVMTVLTVPLTILASALVGLVMWFQVRMPSARRLEWRNALKTRRLPQMIDPKGTGLLFAINFLFPIVLISQPKTPIFGGTKHWMPAMPFLCMFAGYGAVRAAGWAIRGLKNQHDIEQAEQPATMRVVAILVAGVMMLLPAALATKRVHPFGTSYYNASIGEVRGAADAQMMRQFWGYASRQALPWVNEHAPKGARIWTHNTTGWAWNDYKLDGLVRKDLKTGSIEHSDIALYHHQEAFVYMLVDVWRAYGTRTPAHVVTVDGVPVLSVYVRSGYTLKP